MDGTTVALDLAKAVSEVAVADERGRIVERKRLGQPHSRDFSRHGLRPGRYGEQMRRAIP